MAELGYIEGKGQIVKGVYRIICPFEGLVEEIKEGPIIDTMRRLYDESFELEDSPNRFEDPDREYRQLKKGGQLKHRPFGYFD